MRGPLNRDDIVGLLGELSEKLKDRGVRGHIYIIGGAAMVLGFRHDGTTHDVDARIKSDKEAVLAAAAEIAKTHDLVPNWLNDDAAVFIPDTADTRAQTVFDTPHLVVTGASPQHVLAMKLEAARNTDREDIEALLEILRIERREQAVEIHRAVYPKWELEQSAQEIVDQALKRIAARRTNGPDAENSRRGAAAGTPAPEPDQRPEPAGKRHDKANEPTAWNRNDEGSGYNR